jgi:hypothetical protein
VLRDKKVVGVFVRFRATSAAQANDNNMSRIMVFLSHLIGARDLEPHHLSQKMRCHQGAGRGATAAMPS